MSERINCLGCLAALHDGRVGTVCRNGFVQGNYPNYSEPACMREDLPQRWLNEDGSPKFYKPKEAMGYE